MLIPNDEIDCDLQVQYENGKMVAAYAGGGVGGHALWMRLQQELKCSAWVYTLGMFQMCGGCRCEMRGGMDGGKKETGWVDCNAP